LAKTWFVVKQEHTLTIFLVPHSPAQWITAPSGNRYPRQVTIDLGRPGMRYGIEMRDLIHWVAYRLDTGPEGSIINHRAAVLLRGIADHSYPYIADEADYVAEELQDAGVEVDIEVTEATVQRVDARLLCLEDGLVCLGDTFEEELWTGQPPDPVLQHNAKLTIDVPFPEGTKEKFGIRGIRVCVLDLVCWLKEGAIRTALSFAEDSDEWLDELAAAEGRANGFLDGYRARKMQWLSKQRRTEAAGPQAPSAMEQDQILRELSALI
jgi:hypothetical protein